MTTCFKGLPVVVTNPHFSGRIARSIANSIDGLTPDDVYTESYVDVEPVSGIVLNQLNKFQINIHIRQTPLDL